jgi:FeS assembly SUF system regulator
MIRLSRFADYAVAMLAELARDGGMRMAASDMAGRTGLPEPTVAKILKSLTRAGILTSSRGVNGGYGLARTPDDITVADIITAMDGPISLTDCANNSPCVLEGHCSMHGRWGKVNMAIRAALESVTLVDLMQNRNPLPSGRGQGEGSSALQTLTPTLSLKGEGVVMEE